MTFYKSEAESHTIASGLLTNADCPAFPFNLRHQAMSSGQKIPALTGLRGFAIALVLFEHFATGALHLGFVGVQIFFVLSGFLITGRLLEYQVSHSFRGAARAFFWRRTVRLAPVLYVALAAAWWMQLAPVSALGWAAMQLGNIKTFADGHWSPGGHLWSIAVEDQFYLAFFPLIMLTCRPNRWLSALLTGSLVALAVAAGLGIPFFSLLLPGALNGFAAGAILAVCKRNGSSRLDFLDGSIPLSVSALLSCAIAFWPGISGPVRTALLAPCTDLLALCLIGRCVMGSALLLEAWPLRSLGAISYSLYVWHGFLIDAGAGFSVPFIFVGSLIVATISWWLLERPQTCGSPLPEVNLKSPSVRVSPSTWSTDAIVKRA